MKAAFLTLGCKVNSYETEAVAELFRARGCAIVDESEPCDVVVVNTCTVTNAGDQKSRQAIRRAVSAHPEACVVVMGCYSQLQAEQVSGIAGVGVVIGTKDRHLVPAYVDEYRKTKMPVVRIEPLARGEAFESLTIRAFERHQRAFLKIQDGCDNFCSYCIIPYARGRMRSKAPAAVLAEAAGLARSGFSEIVLTGIHTGGYGRDLEGYRFARLLADLAAIPGIARIRISSIEESELTDEVIAILAEHPVFAHHLHIPLQSGSARILKAMNRKYTLDEYERKIALLRSRIPDLAITTDVIAGFPGETEEEFGEMLLSVRRIRFAELHVFPFSKRDGTAAATLPDQIDGTVKKHRVADLLSLSDDLAADYVRKNVGLRLEAIAETHADGILTGHTGNYIRVAFPGTAAEIGRLVPVRITREDYPLSPAVRC